MVEWIPLFDSILSNTTEIHSLELGVQVAVLTIFVMRYSTRELGASFFSVLVGAVFLVSPIEVINAKPWYFLSGILFVFTLFEMHLYCYGNIQLKRILYRFKPIHPKQLLSRFK